MDDFQTRIMNLRADVEELEVVLEKSELVYEERTKFMHKILKIDFTKSKEIQQLVVESSKSTSKANFDVLRDCLAIIKKCSPHAGDQLEDILFKYQKIDDDMNTFFVNLVESPTIDESEQSKEHEQKFEDFMADLRDALDKYTNIRFMVENILKISYALLIDVLDRLEKRNQHS